MLAKLTVAWEKNPTSRLHLARLLNFLLLTDQPVTADKLIREKNALQGYDGKDFELNLALARLDRRTGTAASAPSGQRQVLDQQRQRVTAQLEVRVVRADQARVLHGRCQQREAVRRLRRLSCAHATLVYNINLLLSQQWTLAGLRYPPALQAMAQHAASGTGVDPAELEPVLVKLIMARAGWN